MDLTKHIEFFNPTKLYDEIHVIGLGAIGSNVVQMLTRMGIENMHIYDFDTVSEHNIANQSYLGVQVGSTKIEATEENCLAINPAVQLFKHPEGYSEGMPLSGYVFLCVDNIDLRRAIVEEHRCNPMVKAMFDFRMGLKDAQHYAADWSNDKQVENFLASMQFTHEEAKEATPVSACGTALNVIPTVWTVVSAGIANWMCFVKEGVIKKVKLVNPFDNMWEAY